MEKTCYFCIENINEVDYKKPELLRKFLSGQGKILPPRRTGVCMKHQRILARAIKRARHMAYLPYTSK